MIDASVSDDAISGVEMRAVAQSRSSPTVSKREEARQAALEGRGLEAEMQRQMDEKLAAEKEKRIAHTQEMAIKRIGKRDLVLGWQTWSDTYWEETRVRNMLKAAGSRLSRPKLVASVTLWRRDWMVERDERFRKETMTVEEQLRYELFEIKKFLAANPSPSMASPTTAAAHA